MTRRRREHDGLHDVKVAAAAIATLAAIFILSELTDYDPPTPAPPPADTAPDLSDRHEVAQTVSRSDQRAAPAAPSHARGGAHSDTSGRRSRTGKLAAPVVGQTLRCIRWQESGGDYQAFNGLEHYGAYQLSATYSDDWAREYGYGQWANVTADQWPPSVQDSVASALFDDWPGAWSTLGECA